METHDNVQFGFGSLSDNSSSPRRNFAVVLESAGLDVAAEYETIRNMWYSNNLGGYGASTSLWDGISASFIYLGVRGTCLTFQDFNKRYGFHFFDHEAKTSINDLLSFCEYSFNMAESYLDAIDQDQFAFFAGAERSASLMVEQAECVADLAGYAFVEHGDRYMLIEKNPAAMAVAAVLSDDVAADVLTYYHESMKGDIAGKRAVLRSLANQLEPQRKDLASIDKKLESLLFNAFNNASIRHNNCDPNNPSRFKAAIAGLSREELEGLYDSVYELSLEALTRLRTCEARKSVETALVGAKTAEAL